MKDITKIDWKAGNVTKIVESDPAKIAKQKVFFLQNGVEYDAGGVACNERQVQKYYDDVAAAAQAEANAATEAAAAAKANAADALKTARAAAPKKAATTRK